MNPGLSLTAMILGKLSLPMWIVYSVFQCIGAVVGYALLVVSAFSKQYMTISVCNVKEIRRNANKILSHLRSIF